MKKTALLILVLTAVNFSFAQSRYLVYFKDKGIAPYKKLSRSSNEFISAEAELSPKSIERRIKNMGEENYITFADVPINSKFIDEIKNMGIEIHRQLKWFNAVSCVLSNEQIDEINKLPFVSKIEPVKSLYRNPGGDTTEPDQSLQKARKSINDLDYGPSFNQCAIVDVMAVHTAGFTGEGVTIGLIDAGFDWRNHHATSGLDVQDEYDFIFDDSIVSNEDEDPVSQHNHGTNVLSITGGYDPGNIIGPAFGASFLLAKTEYVASETRVEEDNYIAALQWLESLGADIITSSVGYNTFDAGEESYTYEDMDGRTSLLTQASELAFERGIVTVTSAGNEGNTPWYYITVPADGENIITVGGVNGDKQLAAFSSHGPTYDGRIKPEVVAQAVSVYMATPPVSVYKYANGTSFSAPIVAGVAGLLLSAHPHLTNKQVRKIILESGDNCETPDNNFGYGLISAKDAVAFPSLSFSDEKYTLHKIFFDSDDVVSGSVDLNYSVNGGEFISENLSSQDGIKYTFELPLFIQGDSLKFYFSFRNGESEIVRVPADGSYRFIYGNLNVSYQIGIEGEPFDPVNYSLLQNFPNPFNDQTRIVFLAEAPNHAVVKVYDVLGRKVRDLFNGAAVEGTNTLYWDGKSNEGGRCSSGPYFYTLSIDGKFFSKKLIFLK
ncbi:S8 family serine peptidase [Bacteroidota bacterium]